MGELTAIVLGFALAVWIANAIDWWVDRRR